MIKKCLVTTSLALVTANAMAAAGLLSGASDGIDLKQFQAVREAPATSASAETQETPSEQLAVDQFWKALPAETQQQIAQTVEKKAFKEAVGSIFMAISEHYVGLQDGERKTLKAKYFGANGELQNTAAATSGNADSSNANNPWQQFGGVPGSTVGCHSACHSNCHGNCHGARGWR